MHEHEALHALAALAQEHRLQVLRLLLRQAPDGLPAGQIGACLGLAASTLSSHLAQLERAGLLRSWRVHQQIFYAADTEGFQRLLGFLTEECCDGAPERCGSAPQEDELGSEVIMPPDLVQSAQRVPRGAATVFNVLFLCTGNSARSIMAECLLNRLGQGKFQAYSAGSRPKETVHPYAVELLRHYGYATDHLRSKSWDAFTGPEAPPLDFVFTLCDEAAQEVCPVWLGQPMTAHWGLPDPAAVDGPEAVQRLAFVDTMRMLHRRIGIFVHLPMVKLDQLSLQQRMEAIGKTTPRAARS
jgi:ArsR family transcriptional regulator, arsenate/arsenite/antimonite-responsive transcriptional repressor / arsenate reductase (thioredoxin)